MEWQAGPDYRLRWRPWKTRDHVVKIAARNSDVIDAELKVLSSLSGLETLVLDHCPNLTREAVAYAQGLPELRRLILCGRQITDDWLVAVAKLKQLRTLEVIDAEVTDAGVKQLLKIKRLHTLYLIDTRVTDEALRHLASMDELWTLDIRKNDITDRGLSYLHDLKCLMSIELAGTKVTPDGILALMEALPELKVMLDRAQIASIEEALLREPMREDYEELRSRIVLSWEVERKERAMKKRRKEEKAG